MILLFFLSLLKDDICMHTCMHGFILHISPKLYDENVDCCNYYFRHSILNIQRSMDRGSELMDGDTIMCGWLLIDFVGNRMDAFAQRPKKSMVGHLNITIYPEAQKSLHVLQYVLKSCDHGIGARVGHLEVMHLPSFFFPFPSLHCWPRQTTDDPNE